MTFVGHTNLRHRIEKALTGFLDQQCALLTEIDPALVEVGEAISEYVLGGGKRLRPAFAYWAYRAAGGVDTDAVVAAASALELLQASALMHDDLMDASDTRRGVPALHRRFQAVHAQRGWHGSSEQFGSASAILLGDLCLAWSDQMLNWAGLTPETLPRARSVFDLMRTEVICGQYLDVHAQATGDTSAHRASVVARFKSAKYTVERPLLLGAALAGAGTEITSGYTGFGLPLGEAFQLRDDVLGVFGDPARTGKPAGDDLREGKRTYLVAAAIESATPAAAAQLRHHLGERDLAPEQVTRLREIIMDSGALDQTERRIIALTEDALAALARTPLCPDGASMLATLARAATERTG